jgi:four helix bundle protein
MMLVEETYRVTKGYPADERFGIARQMQRAAVSIPSDIAEGHSRKSTGAYLNHLSIAADSLAELETQILISGRLNLIDGIVQSQLISAADEVGRMLSGLRASLDPSS